MADAMDDTQRLDALGQYGLCIVQHQERIEGEWVASWQCCYGIGNSIIAPTIRQAIDMAVKACTEGNADAN